MKCISHLQLLQDERCLLIVDTGRGEIEVYLESNHDLGHALQHQRPKKSLRQEKIGGQYLLAYDETKRMLVVCATEKV